MFEGEETDADGDNDYATKDSMLLLGPGPVSFGEAGSKVCRAVRRALQIEGRAGRRF